MMRFPLRLTAELIKARITQRLRLAKGVRPIRFVDSAEILISDSNHPISHEKIREITKSNSPVIWIGGSEPLRHPGIAHLVRAITQSGHSVFLETDGTLLRRRIHEFQPTPRLFLTIRMAFGARRRTSGEIHPDAWELSVEGIRAARLSGFSMCVCVRITSAIELDDAVELCNLARSLDMDGIVISPASDASKSSNQNAGALVQKTAEARKLIRSKWWGSFSRLVEPIVSGDRHVGRTNDETSVSLEQVAPANDERVGVG